VIRFNKLIDECLVPSGHSKKSHLSDRPACASGFVVTMAGSDTLSSGILMRRGPVGPDHGCFVGVGSGRATNFNNSSLSSTGSPSPRSRR
jgi:hypothetical protein